MDEEVTNPTNIWVHEECAVISAESHDLWSFTPEFLMSKGIVEADWVCRRATRNQTTVEIQYGPTRWRMNQRDLWIHTVPDRELGESLQIEGNPLAPLMAHRFLGAVPHLPFRRLWFFWQVFVLSPDPLQWILDNFFPQDWTLGFEPTRLQPEFTLRRGDLVVRVAIKNQPMRPGGGDDQNSIVFECFVSAPRDQAVSSMTLSHGWDEKIQIVEQVVRHLLGRVNPDDTN